MTGIEKKGQHPHLGRQQVRERLSELESATGQRKRDLMTELAWRPAWAIRSRRGSIAQWRIAVREWISGRDR